MPIGNHLTSCLNCGINFECGDCIEVFCSDSCKEKWEEKRLEWEKSIDNPDI